MLKNFNLIYIGWLYVVNFSANSKIARLSNYYSQGFDCNNALRMLGRSLAGDVTITELSLLTPGNASVSSRCAFTACAITDTVQLLIMRYSAQCKDDSDKMAGITRFRWGSERGIWI